MLLVEGQHLGGSKCTILGVKDNPVTVPVYRKDRFGLLLDNHRTAHVEESMNR